MKKLNGLAPHGKKEKHMEKSSKIDNGLAASAKVAGPQKDKSEPMATKDLAENPHKRNKLTTSLLAKKCISPLNKVRPESRQHARQLAKQRAAQKELLQQETQMAFCALKANERHFQEAVTPFAIEQIIYERAALFSRCRALLHLLRAGPEHGGSL